MLLCLAFMMQMLPAVRYSTWPVLPAALTIMQLHSLLFAPSQAKLIVVIQVLTICGRGKYCTTWCTAVQYMFCRILVKAGRYTNECSAERFTSSAKQHTQAQQQHTACQLLNQLVCIDHFQMAAASTTAQQERDSLNPIVHTDKLVI